MKDIEDAIPFALPEGWAWCRLGEICEFISRGKTPVYTKESQYPVLAQKCNQWYGIILNNSLFLDPNSLSKWPNEYHLRHEDIVINSTGTGTIGRVGIFDIGILGKYSLIVPDSHISVVRCYKTYIYQKYIYNIFRSEYLQNKINEAATGSTNQKELPQKALTEFFLPIPPLAEQKRIVAAIEAIFYQIDLLEQNKADLQTAFKQAKSKILDLAIHGKLVPQDPDDEPVSVMLEKLRAEKEAKIAAGEIKRGKNESYIYKNPTDNCYYQKYTDGCEENISDEIPFNVPDGWAWCKLPEVCRKPITDGTHNSPPNSVSGDFVYITAKNIKNLKICLDDATYVSKEIHESIYSRCSPELNDVLLTKDGTIGEVAVNKLNYPFSMLSSVALIKPSNGILSWFLAYILISDLLQNKMKKDAKGSALKRIILAQINDFLIPLPPLAEQKRIVVKIEELFAQLDFIMAVPTE